MELQAALLSRLAYAHEHPRNQETLLRAVTALREMLADQADVSLAVIGGDLVFQGYPLQEATPNLATLISHLQACGIETLSLRRNIQEVDLAEFLTGLTRRDPAMATRQFRGIVAGKLKLSSGGQAAAADPSPPPAVRRGPAPNHTEHVDVLRGMSEALEGGKSVDVSAARAVVARILAGLLDNRDAILLAVSLREHDEYSFIHSLNVAIFSMTLAEGLGMGQAAVSEIGMAALLHDAGKLAVSGDLLRKRGKLTPEEYEQMKSHALEGARLLLRTPGLSPLIVAAAFEHHLRYDRSGYPTLVFGKELSLPGMVVAVADVYEALRASRPYREGMSPEMAHEEMMKMAGTGLHPELVEILFDAIGVFPPGTLVELDDGSVGVVFRATPGDMHRPQVEVLYAPGRVKLKEHYFLNLAAPTAGNERSIVRSVNPQEFPGLTPALSVKA